MDGLHGAVGVAADGQEPHGGLPSAVSVAADGQEPHGGLLCAVSVAADGHKPNWCSLFCPYMYLGSVQIFDKEKTTLATFQKCLSK